MASTVGFLNYVLEQLSGAEGLRFRPMMGEYVLYVRGKVIGGVYDDRLLLKSTPGALRLLRESGFEPETGLPYPGAKPMLAADTDRPELLRALARTIAEEIP